MSKKILPILIVLCLCILFVNQIDAQCPMCKMSAESNLEHGGTAGKGLNKGILYMFLMPYILVSTLGLIWYRNKKKTLD